MKSLLDLIYYFIPTINALVALCGGLSLLFFLYGVFKYISAGAGHGKEDGRTAIVWGIVGLFVLTCLWGIVNIAASTLLGGTGYSGGSSYPSNTTFP